MHKNQYPVLLVNGNMSVDVGEFERLAREAISYYVGDETRILGNLSVVLDNYHRSEDES